MYYPYENQHRYQGQGPRRMMTVLGSGGMLLKPDMVRIQLEVVTSSENVQEAQQKNAQQMNRVIQALIQLGIRQEHLQTTGFNIQPIYDFDDGQHVFRGYEVVHTLTIQHHGIEDVGQIIDTVVQEGANRITNIAFDLLDKQRYEREALQVAVRDAADKAKMIATELSVTVDLIPMTITEVSEGFGSANGMVMKMEGNTSTNIEPGQIYVQALIEAEFQYE